LSREERRRIFAKCIAADNSSSTTQSPYPTGWFLPENTIPKREVAVDWLLWALFSTTRSDGLVEEHKEEIDGYIEEIERILGTRLEPGTDDGARSLRITLDPVTMLHRPLIWYSVCYSSTGFFRLTDSWFLYIDCSYCRHLYVDVPYFPRFQTLFTS
jgi:hypothetical protein